MGRHNKQTGVTLKPALDIPEGRMANVEVSIDIAVNGQDPTAIVVEISGDGQIADGVSDRKSTRLNSSHANISYAVFCLKKKKKKHKKHQNDTTYPYRLTS